MMNLYRDFSLKLIWIMQASGGWMSFAKDAVFKPSRFESARSRRFVLFFRKDKSAARRFCL